MDPAARAGAIRKGMDSRIDFCATVSFTTSIGRLMPVLRDAASGIAAHRVV